MKATLRRAAWRAGVPVRLLLVFTVKLYRVTLSGLLGGQCRFHPSCSVYAEEAVRTHGAVRGGLMSAWRVLRCSPLTRGGWDPVPPKEPPVAMYDGVIRGGRAA